MNAEQLSMDHLQQNEYDYIITGAGCAGLSLLIHLLDSDSLRDKRILLIDKDEKKNNDRTWCFWETGTGKFESLVYRKWKEVWFHSDQFSRLLSLAPYTYKLIRGIDFYEYCFARIASEPRVEFIHADVKEIRSTPAKTSVLADDREISTKYIFNSILLEKPGPTDRIYYLLQHFKGWIIETDAPVFNPEQAILMDFRVDQHDGTTFAYVLPFSEKRALVEYTLFSKELLKDADYEEGLRKYIREHIGDVKYTVTEEEFGVIPMTNFPFVVRDNNIIHIGTAGGQTKASTGYTFRFIQKQAAAITAGLVQSGHPFEAGPPKKRFRFYDSVLLAILQKGKLPGQKIFTDLFKKNETRQVLRFLDNESSLKDEFRVISSLPTWPFLKAALKHI